jgi:predicted RNA-binding protein YlqC (UPF0109 family)
MTVEIRWLNLRTKYILSKQSSVTDRSGNGGKTLTEEEEKKMPESLSEKMKNLVEFLAKSLVEKPDEVVVESKESEKTVLVELKVASEDLGRVIGKDGHTINAIRLVLQTAAASHDKKVRLDLLS